MILSYGKVDSSTGYFEYTCLRNENLSFLFNNFKLELKDHNRAAIRPGFISRTLEDQDFQHTINSLHFLIGGHAILYFEGERHELSAGSVFLIGNHVKCHWVYTEPSEEITLLFNAYMGTMDDLFSHLTRPLIRNGQTREVEEADCLFDRESSLAVLSLRNLCLRYVMDFLEESAINLDDRISIVKKYEAIFRCIAENLSMSLTIEELAAKTNYSVGFFTKSFPKDNGVTVKQYIHDKIMSEVEQLLIYSDLTAREIAEQFNFCEPAYFSRWFKKYKGCSPSEYRAHIRIVTGKQGAGTVNLVDSHEA